jgi:hypothetical protein
MRAKMKQMEQQANVANKVMDDRENALLNKHLTELKQQGSTHQSGKFTLDLAFGTSKDALNLAAFLGMSEEYTREVNRNGEATMKREIEALQTTGRLPNDPSWWFDRNSDEVLEHWNYVVHETSSEKQYPNGIRDEGRPPTNLEDFMTMPQAIKAKLSRAQVIALRLYTTLIYSYINEPLRHKEFYRTFADQPNQPRHPLSAVVWYIFTGLKQLREVVDMKQGEHIVLWRGMKNVSCVPSTFMENGGAEPAPMSTSRDMIVALNYGTEGSSMNGSVLFKIVVRNDLEMGADIQWLSAFPQEAEVLYPPLALLIPSKKEIKVLDGGGGVSSRSINIIEMSANLSSGLGLVVGESEDVGFMKGDKVCVLLGSDLLNGEVVNVSASDGVKVKHENGKEGEYIPKKLREMIENGKQEIIRLNKIEEEKRRNKAVKEKADREKSHPGSYIDHGDGDHKRIWKISSYGGHSDADLPEYQRGEWKRRWTARNSWTCCKSKDKKDLSCRSNPIYCWSCCGAAPWVRTCKENPLGMKWTCCGQQNQTNLVCGLYSQMDRFKAAGCDCEVTQNGLAIKPGYNSLSKALKEAKKYNINQILLGNGVHDERGECVYIDFPITIIGESKDGCTIIGGLEMKGKKKDDVNVKNLTISQSKYDGVCGYDKMSFHLFNLNIEKSGNRGVHARETWRNTITSCQVSHSKKAGVEVYSGLITLNGSGTSIHNNVTCGHRITFGLETINASIHLVSPLTKQKVFINNGGGGNYGGWDTNIKIITENTNVQ